MPDDVAVPPPEPAAPPVHEVTEPVSLTRPDGRLNPAALGYARRPLIDTTGMAAGHGWGRLKRWEQWTVITPTHIVALTISALNYAALHDVWLFDRTIEQTWTKSVTRPFSRGVTLPARLGAGPAHARARDFAIDIEPTGAHPLGGARQIRLTARIPDAEFDLVIARPDDHDCIASVAQTGKRGFRYSVKDIALPATGTITIERTAYDVPAGKSWAALNHARGRWPYDVHFVWGTASGLTGGMTTGLQLGGGPGEMGFVVDGVLYPIMEELSWQFDPHDPLGPWHVTGGGLDATLTPFFHRSSSHNACGVLAAQIERSFGSWAGTFTESGETLTFAGLDGWAEEAYYRW